MEPIVANAAAAKSFMQQHWQDWFIGGTSILLGLVFTYWAIFDIEVGQRLKLAKLVAEMYGRGASRIFYALLGMLLVLIGAAIASGYSLELIGRAATPPQGQEFSHFSPRAAA